MSKTVIEHVLSRLQDIGIKDVFGVAGDFAFPIDDATARNVRKATRVIHPAAQRLRDAFGSWSPTDQSDYSNYIGRRGQPASMTTESKSCDVVWCYEN